MINTLNNFIKEHKNNMENDLLKIIAIESVESVPSDNAPFGKNVGKALDLFCKFADNLGLKYHNHNGYYVTVDLGEITEPYQAVGILTHADVVPLGEGWHFNPLGEIRDNRIYGRGSLDDKGPAIASLYALAAIKESNIKLNKPIRLIVGGNEETGSKCIHRYNEENIPLWGGFSPDGDFPVIFAEKGIAIHKSQFKAESRHIKSIQAGTAVNAVPGKATAVLHGIDLIEIKQLISAEFKNKNITVEYCDNHNIAVTVIGKSAHGSTPERGINAVKILLEILLKLPADPLTEKLNTLYRLFCVDYNGKYAEIYREDDVSGKLTLNLGVLNYNNNTATWELDLRYPVTESYNPIKAKLDEILGYSNLTLTCSEHKPPLYVKKDSPLIKTLVDIYAESGRTDTEPLAIGGGTYCRNMKNFVAFGPLGADDVDTMHQADEYIEREHLLFLAKIYAKAIYTLAK